jgi:hypothetical protein
MPILFADDASVLISHSNPIKFRNTINEVYGLLDDWFKKNLMSLNTIKTCYINFTAKNKVEIRYNYYNHKLYQICWPDNWVLGKTHR